jgi:hypothetical protein
MYASPATSIGITVHACLVHSTLYGFALERDMDLQNPTVGWLQMFFSDSSLTDSLTIEQDLSPYFCTKDAPLNKIHFLLTEILPFNFFRKREQLVWQRACCWHPCHQGSIHGLTYLPMFHCTGAGFINIDSYLN